MKEQLIYRWNAFSTKEQSILKLISILTLAMVFYAFIWLPVQHNRMRLSQLIPEKKATLMKMSLQAKEIERLRGQFKIVRNTSDGLKAAVEISAKFNGLTPIYSPVTLNNGTSLVEITLKQVSFETWLKWVDSLQTQNHVRVQSCRIVPSVSHGQVNINAVFNASD